LPRSPPQTTSAARRSQPHFGIGVPGPVRLDDGQRPLLQRLLVGIREGICEGTRDMKRDRSAFPIQKQRIDPPTVPTQIRAPGSSRRTASMSSHGKPPSST
jgi:hypothetical protein